MHIFKLVNGVSAVMLMVAVGLPAQASAPSLRQELQAGITAVQKQKPKLTHPQAAGYAIRNMGKQRGLDYKSMHAQLTLAGIVRADKPAAPPPQLKRRAPGKIAGKGKKLGQAKPASMPRLSQRQQTDRDFYASLNRQVKQGTLSLADQQYAILARYTPLRPLQATAAAAYAPVVQQAPQATPAEAAIATATAPVRLNRSEIRIHRVKTLTLPVLAHTRQVPPAAMPVRANLTADAIRASAQKRVARPAVQVVGYVYDKAFDLRRFGDLAVPISM